MKRLHAYRRCLRIILIMVLLSVGSFYPGQVRPAQAAGDVGYVGPSYGTATSGTSSPTGQKPQSKLWYNDGIWWGVLFNGTAGDFHIYRLDWTTQTWSDTGTLVDSRNFSQSDTLWDGSHLYVASAVRPGTSTINLEARILRYSYDAATRSYTLDAGFPVVLATVAMEAIVLDKDSTGTLWATYTGDNGAGGRQVYVTHSTTADQTWVAPYVLPATGATTLHPDDLSALVSFNGQIGIMWSNQTDHAMYFATHTDGAPDTEWALNPAVQGPYYADDHLNLKSLQADASGQVFAVTKTSLNDVTTEPTEPLILLLVLDQQGSWSRRTVWQVGDDTTRPIVLLDNENRKLYAFAAGPCCSGGTVYYKQVSLDNASMQFEQGLGTPFIQSSTNLTINNPTSTKQALNTASGLVVLASDDSTHNYLHNVINFGTADVTPPTVALTEPAEGATVGGSVTLSADAADDVEVVQVEFLVDEAVVGTDTTAPYSVAWDSTTVADGSHAIAARARDLATNTTTSASRTVAVSNPVDTTIDSGPEGTVSATTASFTFSASKAGSTFECSLDGAAFEACASPKEYTGLAEGAHTFQVRAVDTAGNVDATPASGTWTIDPTAPVILTFAADADARVREAYPDTNYGTATVLEVDGGTGVAVESYLRFTASGLSGAVESAKLRVYVTNGSTNGPAVYPAGASWTETGITWNNRPGATGVATEDKGAIAADTWAEYDVTPLVTGDGTYNFVLAGPSTDGVFMAAREATTNTPQLVVTTTTGGTSPDTTPPVVALTAPADGATVGGSVTLAADATDNVAVDHVAFLVDGTVVGSDTSAPYSVAWDSSVHGGGTATITAEAVDTATNAATSASHTVTVDNTVPETSLDSGPEGTVSSTTASFSFSSPEAGSTFECRLDGAAFEVCASPKEYTGLADGEHTFDVRAVDTAGNVDASPASRTWTIATSTTTIAVGVEADAYVTEALPDTNNGTAVILEVDGGDGRALESYLRFSISGVSGAITSAKLRVFATAGSLNGPAVYATGTDWTETEITWNNKPARIGDTTDDKATITTDTWMEYDVTPLVTGNGTYSFVLAPTSNDGLDMHAREAASSDKPELVLTVANDSGDTTAP